MKVSASSPFDKLYWLRVAFGAAAGLLANWAFSPTLDYTDGILVAVIVYLGSYYLARYGWYRKLDRKDFGKIYTTGIGVFIMLFIFTWILLFTLAL
jgi:hypothetical protein